MSFILGSNGEFRPMTYQAVILPPKAQTKQVVIPNFFSLKAETYFCSEIIPNLNFESIPSDGEYHFEIHKDPLSESIAKQQLTLFEEWMKRSTLTVLPLLDSKIRFSYSPIFANFSDSNPSNIHQGYYKFTLNLGSISYLKTLKAIHYSSIDWQCMKSLHQKHSKKFYKFLKTASLSGITEFTCDWEKVMGLFDISETDYKKWKKHQNNFLENVRQELAQHPTNPLFFEYSTHKSFDKNEVENRNYPYLYFRIVG